MLQQERRRYLVSGKVAPFKSATHPSYPGAAWAQMAEAGLLNVYLVVVLATAYLRLMLLLSCPCPCLLLEHVLQDPGQNGHLGKHASIPKKSHCWSLLEKICNLADSSMCPKVFFPQSSDNRPWACTGCLLGSLCNRSGGRSGRGLAARPLSHSCKFDGRHFWHVHH